MCATCGGFTCVSCGGTWEAGTYGHHYAHASTCLRCALDRHTSEWREAVRTDYRILNDDSEDHW